MTTISEIFARFPPGDTRLKALEEWRKAQFNEPPPQTTKPQHVEIPTLVHPDSQLARSALPAPHVENAKEWWDRKETADRQREAEQAAAIKARLNHAVNLTMARSVRIADAKDRQAKMLRLGELQELLAKDPKALGRISGTLADIEARLARLDG